MSNLFKKIESGGVYTIAEMSANHAGKLDNAINLVHIAKEMGADCLKIQTYTADTITINCRNEYFKINGGLWDGYNLYDLYKEAYTPWEWQPIIKKECEKIDIDFLSTPFDTTAVDFLEKMNCDAYKIASFELVDIPLIEYTARLGKPMIISCGMGSETEIREAINACHKMGNNKIVLLKCCSEYPTNPENLNLATIRDMKSKFNVEIGLSDHSMGFMADVVAVANGARVIEKHFCISRSLKNPDSDFSMEPHEFAEMVNNVNIAAKMIGKVYYGPTKSECEEYKCRRSIFAIKDIKEGDIFTSENVRSIRPNNGLAPKYLPNLIGKKSKRHIAFGQPIKMQDLEE